MDPGYGHGAGGKFIKECREIEPMRPEAKNEEIAKTLWETSEKQIERLEKQAAVKRALEKKEAEETVKKGNTDTKTANSGNVETANGTTTTSEKQQMAGSRRNRKQNG